MITSVGRCAALETILGKPIISSQFTSLRDVTQIYCELHGICLTELGATPVPEIVAYVRDFFTHIREPSPDREPLPYQIQPLTIPVMIQMEDAIGTPFFDPAFDFGLIATQLACVEYGYGLQAADMARIRDMPYPDYLADVWMPLYQQIHDALVPPSATNSPEDLPEKNQLEG